MAVFWMTEALPLAITSLLPVVLFPLLGIMGTGKVCTAYMKVGIDPVKTIISSFIIQYLALDDYYAPLFQLVNRRKRT